MCFIIKSFGVIIEYLKCEVFVEEN